ncbi:MAG: diaminopimelate epimerase [Planctomycetes bacterium]|nr:diaminopimelate epimerase [Planctomycetota bacterium]
MQFTKMHGAGNDYVYVNTFEQPVDDPPAVAQTVSDRHFGVGSDGLVLIGPADDADVRMCMFNADGSESEMCGNAIRCVAKYAWEHGLVRTNPMRIATRAGVKTIDLTVEDDRVIASSVDMGEPILDPARIPVALDDTSVIEAPLDIGGPQTWPVTCVSMGNPHAVTFLNDRDALAALPLATIGPRIENHAWFPKRINAHVVVVDGPGELTMRTWERGTGETLACGTGASAVCVAGVLSGRTSRDVQIHLPGGDLEIAWREADNHVIMTGPAVEVFSGLWQGAVDEA